MSFIIPRIATGMQKPAEGKGSYCHQVERPGLKEQESLTVNILFARPGHFKDKADISPAKLHICSRILEHREKETNKNHK